MKQSGKHVVTLVRLLVCIGALSYVLWGVSLHDHATLDDGQKVRIVAYESDRLHVQINGETSAIDRRHVRQDADGDEMIRYGLLTALRQSDKRVLLLCLLLFPPVPLLQSLRFMLLLRAQDIRLSLWESIKICFAGNFLNFVAPGTTGGDVLKAYYVAMHTPHKTEAVTTVFLDRVAGLMSMLIIVAIVVFVQGPQGPMWTVGWLCLMLLAGIVVFGWVQSSEWLRKKIAIRARVPGWLHRPAGNDQPDQDANHPRSESAGVTNKWARAARWAYEHLGRADSAVRRLLRHKTLALSALLTAVALQAGALAIYVMICAAVGMEGAAGARFWEYFTVVATANMVGSIPISFQGLGTVEAVYKHFLLGPGASLSQILCMAMAIRLLNLFWSLPGVLVTMSGAHKPRSTDMSTMEAAVAEMKG